MNATYSPRSGGRGRPRRTLRSIPIRGAAPSPGSNLPPGGAFNAPSAAGFDSVLAEAWHEITTRLADAGLTSEDEELSIDVFDEPGEMVLVAECSGANDETVRVEAHGSNVGITCVAGPHTYTGSVTLPADCAGTPTVAVRNGVMEVRFAKADTPSSEESSQETQDDERRQTRC